MDHLKNYTKASFNTCHMNTVIEHSMILGAQGFTATLSIFNIVVFSLRLYYTTDSHTIRLATHWTTESQTTNSQTSDNK
ncbi:hypothetical protein BsWGS_07447 [Bradybaena similaris]